MLPQLGALAWGAFHLCTQYLSLFLEMGGLVGILKVAMVGVG
jgi:hypothetical protein